MAIDHLMSDRYVLLSFSQSRRHLSSDKQSYVHGVCVIWTRYPDIISYRIPTIHVVGHLQDLAKLAPLQTVSKILLNQATDD